MKSFHEITVAGRSLSFCPLQFPHDSLADELLPPGLCLTVPHDQVAIAQVATGAGVVDDFVERPIKGDRRVQRGQKVMVAGTPPTVSFAISCQVIICKRISSSVAVYFESYYGLQSLDPFISVVESSEFWSSIGGMPSRGGAAGENIGVRHAVYAEVCFPTGGTKASRP